MMALVSLPPSVPNSESSLQDLEDKENEEEIGELVNVHSPARKTKKRLLRQGSVSENFFAVHGSTLVLPRQTTLDEKYMEAMKGKKFAGDLKTHMYAIYNIIREQDSIKLVARLESWVSERPRYLVIISTNGRQDTEESIILGMDFHLDDNTKCNIGLVIPIWTDTVIKLDGDGGFQVTGRDRTHTFKPVSVQAMWSALQMVHRCVDTARKYNYFYGSLYLTWTCYYESRVDSVRLFLNEWEYLEDISDRRPNYFQDKDTTREPIEQKIRGKLKQVMMKMDLDSCNSKDVRQALEKVIDLDLTNHKKYIDTEMMTILGQMDSASKILDFLYLGSAWNASDLEELNRTGITHILNITMEIDNYFPDNFVYKNVRYYDELESDLLPEWNDTWKFVKQAQRANGKCLVHCRMGISRSSATVAAFLMKEYLWSMGKALAFIRERREIIYPNEGFMRQLQEYEGILNASAQRHNLLFRSRSESNLIAENETNKSDKEQQTPRGSIVDQQPTFDLNRQLLDLTVLPYSTIHKKPKSWSPGDARHYFMDDSVTDHFDELGSGMNRSHLSEPREFLAESTRFVKDSAVPQAADRRKKWRRRHTENFFPLRNLELESVAQSEDSVFPNPGDVPVPRIDAWMAETRSLPADTKRKSNRMSSPAAMETTKSSLDVEREQVHSSFISPMNSPSFKCTKDVNVSSLKNQYIDTVLKVDVTNTVPVVQQTDIAKPSGSKIAPLSENISDANVSEDVESEGRDSVGQLASSRERSFSENQLFNVKNIVYEIENRGKENQEKDNAVGISRSQSLSASKNSSMEMTLGDTHSTMAKDQNQNNNNSNNNVGQFFPSTTVIEIDHDANNSPQIVKTTSQPGCSIKEKVSSSDITLALVGPDESSTELRRNPLARMLTQSELHVIREVGKTFLSEPDDTDSVLLSESSSQSTSSTHTIEEETTPIKNRGVVRRMAKIIESKIKQQNDEQPDGKSTQSSTDSTTVINKLLMGGPTNPPMSVDSNCINKNNNNSESGMDEAKSIVEPSTQVSSKLNDLLSLVGPTPYSPMHTSLASSAFAHPGKSSIERYQRKGRLPIRRTQSERSFARPIKSLLFHSFREKQSTSNETELLAQDSQFNPSQDAPPVAVKKIVENIESLGVNDDKLRSRFEFARKKRLFSSDSPSNPNKKQMTRSISNPHVTQKTEGHRSIKSVFSRNPFSASRSRNKCVQTQFQRHNNLYKTM
ncbi:uncharacterized protein LOC120329453 isoform X1 [Styela clava]